MVLKGGPPVNIPRQWQWRAAWKQEVQEQPPGADSAGSTCLRAIKTGEAGVAIAGWIVVMLLLMTT